jgi:hypothetical protein
MGNAPHFSKRADPKDPQSSKVRTLHDTAKPQPDQGTRTPDSGAGDTATLAGRGTMEQK